MSKCHLVLTDYRQQSKAHRFFWFFKPKECIQWEPFDLYLTFQNDSNDRFEGGKCDFEIKGQLLTSYYTVNVPPIEPAKDKTVSVRNIVTSEAGTSFLTRIRAQTKDEKQVRCKDTDGEDTSRAMGAYSLAVASREEIYQKYAVVVALFFSVLASILTIVNVLVAILG